MGLTQNQVKNIENILTNSLRDKFKNYKPETSSMPFHTRLLGKDRLALYSFIHSLSTNFGTTIFEPVAVAMAKDNFKTARSHVSAGDHISTGAQIEIQKIMDSLVTASSSPDKKKEIETIRKVSKSGNIVKVKPTLVDLFLEDKNGIIYLFDIKTAKPNVGNFKEFKRTLLEWVAVTVTSNPLSNVNTLIAIPYNPYEPARYNRWTMRGMFDMNNELKVAKEFWDFLGGNDAYQDLLNCFERVGIKMRSEIDSYFSNFNKF